MNLFLDKSHKTILARDGDLTTKSEGIKVIGAGLPRTGTLSLKAALTQLYSGKCYHMMDVFMGDQEDVEVWVKAARGEMKPQDWRNFFERKNYVTGVDFPFALFYKDIMAAYPEAKVVLSTRDPKTWHSSVYNSIFQMGMLIRNHRTVSLLMKMLDWRRPSPDVMHAAIAGLVPQGCDVGFEKAIESGPAVAEKFFQDWEAEVRRVVPKEKLLVASAKEGWAPLCKFLGVPVPENDYPRVNDTAAIQRTIRNIKIMNAMVFYVLPVTIGVSLYVYREDLAPAAKPLLETVLGYKNDIQSWIQRLW